MKPSLSLALVLVFALAAAGLAWWRISVHSSDSSATLTTPTRGAPTQARAAHFARLHQELDGLAEKAIHAHGYSNEAADAFIADVKALGNTELTARRSRDREVEVLTSGSPVPRTLSFREPQQ